MKLNYKRTIFVGFAFFLICTFWQAYDTIIPKILTDKFGMAQAASGIVMALDNILALFLLPLFGSISDRCTSKRGRRTPVHPRRHDHRLRCIRLPVICGQPAASKHRRGGRDRRSGRSFRAL